MREMKFLRGYATRVRWSPVPPEDSHLILTFRMEPRQPRPRWITLVLQGFFKAQAWCRVAVRASCVNGDTKGVLY